MSAPSHRGSPVTWKSVWERLSQIKTQFERAGIRVSGSSRLARHAAIMDRLNARGGETHSYLADKDDLERLFQSLLDQREFGLIAEVLLPHNEWHPIIRKCVGGSELPRDDQKHDARNSQFEAYLAAVLKSRGARIEPGEPDLLLTVDGLTLSIACKRVQTAEKFSDRIAEACDQINQVGRAGFVAIEVSRVLYPKSGGLQVTRDHKATDFAREAARTFLDRQQPKIEKAVRGHCTLGLLVAHGMCYWHSEEQRAGTASECFPASVGEPNMATKKWLHILRKRFLSGAY